jgi:signal peptidase II
MGSKIMVVKKFLRTALIVLIVIANIGCDQLTKAVARQQLKGKPGVSLLGGIVLLRYVENDGAFLGLGSGFAQPWKTGFTILLPIAIVAGMIVFLFRRREMDALLVIGASCILGGGASNLLDRILYGGRVSDFLNFGIGGLRTGILNVADLSITAGCALFLVYEIRSSRDRKIEQKKPRPQDPAKE